MESEDIARATQEFEKLKQQMRGSMNFKVADLETQIKNEEIKLAQEEDLQMKEQNDGVDELKPLKEPSNEVVDEEPQSPNQEE